MHPISLSITLFRLIVGLILVAAGTAKLVERGRFVRAVFAYELLPFWAVRLLAILLPWAELIAGAFLVLGLLTKLAATIIVSLLLIFTLAVAVGLLRGYELDCGCFGRMYAEKIRWRVVLRNLVLIALTILIYIHDGGVATIDAWLGLDRIPGEPFRWAIAAFLMTVIAVTAKLVVEALALRDLAGA